MRAIYCDSGRLSSSTNLLSSAEITGNNLNVFNSFSFEFSLLPAEEADLKGAGAIESDETVGLLAESGSDSDVAALPLPASTPFLANPKIKEFQTSIEDLNLTAAEEALLAEALRNPIHVSFDIQVLSQSFLLLLLFRNWRRVMITTPSPSPLITAEKALIFLRVATVSAPKFPVSPINT